jgi:DNA-binding FrmR family transcriptional regulator
MVEEDKYCIDILTQVSAVTRALQSVALGLLDEHLSHCVTHAVAEGGDTAAAKVREASEAVVRPHACLERTSTPEQCDKRDQRPALVATGGVSVRRLGTVARPRRALADLDVDVEASEQSQEGSPIALCPIWAGSSRAQAPERRKWVTL